MLGTFVLSTGYYDAYFSKAQKIRRMLVEKTNNVFDKYDIVIMPVSPTTAFPIGCNNKNPVAMPILQALPQLPYPYFHIVITFLLAFKLCQKAIMS